MKKLILFSLIVILSPLSSAADTVILKNGMRFESNKIWQEGNEIKCLRNGIVIGFSKDDVESIEQSANQMPSAQSPPLEAREPPKTPAKESVEAAPEFNLGEVQKRFERIQKELDMAYQMMLKDFMQLQADKKHLKPGAATHKYNDSVLIYHQKLNDYERKRKAFKNQVEDYKILLEKENNKQLFDDEKFSALLKEWLNRPIDDFIDLWGYADKIIELSDNNKQYLFVIEVTPSFTRNILFLTNSAGKIIDFKTYVD